MRTDETTVSEASAAVEPQQQAAGDDGAAAEPTPARAPRGRSRKSAAAEQPSTAAASDAPAGDAAEAPSTTTPARAPRRRKGATAAADEQPAGPSAAIPDPAAGAKSVAVQLRDLDRTLADETAGPGLNGFTEAQHRMLDALGTPKDPAARALLFYKAKRTGLDPFEMLYLRKDWSNKAQQHVYSVGTRIDGFRTVAKNQSTYRGQTAPMWVDRNGQVHKVWVQDGAPVAAVVGVYVEGYTEPLYGIARFSEFCPKGAGPDSMWRRMAAHMIAKVAEALAIRKAYPDLLADVYTSEELAQRTIELAEIEITGSPVAMAFDRAARAAQTLAAAREEPGQLDHIAGEANRLGLLDEFMPEENRTLRQCLGLVWCTEAVAYARQHPGRIDDLRAYGQRRQVIAAPMPTEQGLTFGEVLTLIQQQAGHAPAAAPVAAPAASAAVEQPAPAPAVAVEAAPVYEPQPAPAIPCAGLCGREVVEADARWYAGSAYCTDCGTGYGYGDPESDEPYSDMYDDSDAGDNDRRELAEYGAAPAGW